MFTKEAHVFTKEAHAFTKEAHVFTTSSRPPPSPPTLRLLRSPQGGLRSFRQAMAGTVNGGVWGGDSSEEVAPGMGRQERLPTLVAVMARAVITVV